MSRPDEIPNIIAGVDVRWALVAEEPHIPTILIKPRTLRAKGNCALPYLSPSLRTDEQRKAPEWPSTRESRETNEHAALPQSRSPQSPFSFPLFYNGKSNASTRAHSALAISGLYFSSTASSAIELAVVRHQSPFVLRFL
jgi:hypothetical protein